MNSNNLPDTFVVLSYDCVYDDYNEVDVHSLLKDIPTICILHFATELYKKVIFRFGDNAIQRSLIYELCGHVKKQERKRIREFLKKHKKVCLVESSGILLLEALALQNYTIPDDEDDSLGLCDDEYERVYKALLYCNQRWTDTQVLKSGDANLTNVSLLQDVPYVEFKMSKDFKPQFYKAIRFFEFCETNPTYSCYLPIFCKDKRVEYWKKYLMRLFSALSSSINSQYIKVSAVDKASQFFFDQYVVNFSECGNLWDGNKAVVYFRDHFLVKLPKGMYLVLNWNLLVDKLYQGMRFDFFRSLKNHGLADSKGNLTDSFPVFSSDIGDIFSEQVLLYGLMQKIFAGRCDVLFTGQKLKQKGIKAEPDLYMRIGKTLFLFEYKDVTMGDAIKYSGDADKIRQGIKDRLCRYERGKSKKGVGQLLYTMEEIFNNRTFDVLDPDVKNVTKVFPIVITTDRTFYAIGVSLYVIEEYVKMKEEHKVNFSGFISIPVLMEIDTIINCAYNLSNGTLDLAKMIINYISKNYYNLAPFNTFVIDNYQRKSSFDKNDAKFLFGDFIEG